MYANNLKQLAYRLGWLGSLSTILVMALLYLANTIVNTSQGAVVPLKSSSVPIMGGSSELVYQVHCWQEGKEIISETNLEWSMQSTRGPTQEWLGFVSSDGHQSQLMVMPIGTAVCQVHGRSRAH